MRKEIVYFVCADATEFKGKGAKQAAIAHINKFFPKEAYPGVRTLQRVETSYPENGPSYTSDFSEMFL